MNTRKVPSRKVKGRSLVEEVAHNGGIDRDNMIGPQEYEKGRQPTEEFLHTAGTERNVANLGSGSTQPVLLTETSATVGMEVAILVERIAGLTQIIDERELSMRRALVLQAEEYERRLVTLNNEAARIRAVQNQSVTAEKFDDYIESQHAALELALKAVNDKTDSVASRFDEKLTTSTSAFLEKIDTNVSTRTAQYNALNDKIEAVASYAASERGGQLLRIERLETTDRARVDGRVEHRATNGGIWQAVAVVVAIVAVLITITVALLTRHTPSTSAAPSLSTTTISQQHSSDGKSITSP